MHVQRLVLGSGPAVLFLLHGRGDVEQVLYTPCSPLLHLPPAYQLPPTAPVCRFLLRSMPWPPPLATKACPNICTMFRVSTVATHVYSVHRSLRGSAPHPRTPTHATIHLQPRCMPGTTPADVLQVTRRVRRPHWSGAQASPFNMPNLRQSVLCAQALNPGVRVSGPTEEYRLSVWSRHLKQYRYVAALSHLTASPSLPCSTQP